MRAVPNRRRRPLIAVMFAATLIATTAAHCEAPPPASYPESATLELLNGPVVTAGDTLRIRVGLDEGGIPWNWILYLTGPAGQEVSQNYVQFPAGDCGELSGRVNSNFNPVKRFVEAECVLPTHFENGAWTLSVFYGGGMVGPTVPFEVTGGSDDHSGPTVEFTELPAQPVAVGQTFEVAARVTDPNGFGVWSHFLAFPGGPGPDPVCELITPAPYPTFDIEVRFHCTTTATVPGVYPGTIGVSDSMRRVGHAPITPVVTIV